MISTLQVLVQLLETLLLVVIFNVTGDIVYDEANARNWNITGVATAATLDVSAAGFSTAAVDDCLQSLVL